MTNLQQAYDQASVDFAKNLVNVFGDLNGDINRLKAWKWSIKNGCATTARWLPDNYDVIHITRKHTDDACRSGSADLLECMLNVTKPDCVLSLVYTACHCGCLAVLDMLICKYPNIDIHANNEALFRRACMCSQTHVIEWLLERYPDIDVRVENDCIFRDPQISVSCKKYILQMYPDIDIHAENCDAFMSAYKIDSVSTIEYLEDITRNQDISYHRSFNITCLASYSFCYIVSSYILNVPKTVHIDCDDFHAGLE